MNQTDQFNVKCGDQTPDLDFLIPLIERQKILNSSLPAGRQACLSPACPRLPAGRGRQGRQECF